MKRRSVLDFNRKALNLFGLWPIDSRVSAAGSRWRRVLPLAILCRCAVMLVLEAMSIKMAWGNTNLTVEFIIVFIFFVHSSVKTVAILKQFCLPCIKFITVYWHRARIRHVFARVDQLNDDLVRVSRRNIAILGSTDTLSERINKYPAAFVMAGVLLALSVLVPYTLIKRQIAFILWLPYDITTSPSFEITTVVLSASIFIDLATVTICDLCVIIPVLQLTGQLQMLSSNIEHAKLIVDHNLKSRSRRGVAGFPRMIQVQEGSTRRVANVESMKRIDFIDKYLGRLVEESSVGVEDEESKRGVDSSKFRNDMVNERLALMREEMTPRMMDEIMGVNVNHHQQIINLVKEIQSIFNALFADQVVFNGLLGVAGLYISTLAKKTDPKVLAMASFIFGGLVEFFFICFCCDLLTIASMRVFDSAYECDWLEASESFKRSLRLLMTRAQKHLAIKAAGIPLSRRTFRAVCKGSYYLQSILNKIYKKT